MVAYSNIPFPLAMSTSPEALQILRRLAYDAVDAGHLNIEIDVDDIGALESPSISTLISILRKARERGATVSLRASRKNILDTLCVTGLDKVFRIVAPAHDTLTAALPASSAARPVGKRRRFVASLAVWLLAMSALLGTRAWASDTPADILHHVIAQNAEMHSYQAQVSVDFHLRSFPYVSQHLDGTTYFKRHDNFEVVFDKVPSYAKGFEKLYSDIDDPTSWERRFDLSLVGEKTVNGHRDVVVRLVQKVRGMIGHEDVAIDGALWRIDEMEWHYSNGGVIAMTQEYQQVGIFTVLAKQHATIHIPFVHAAADATYGDYQTNVAIDDSVFARNKR